MSNKTKIEILEFKDAKKAARTLYEAFDNDDVAKYVSRHLENEPERKKEVDLQLYEAYIISHIMKGVVFAIKGDNHEDKETFETVSIWVKPDSGALDDYLTLIRSGFAKLAWNTGSEGRRRIFNVMFKVLHDKYDEIVQIDEKNKENVWTLVYLGSTPLARGKGNVRKLFNYVFENYIDVNHSLTYLESSSLKNIPIYEKFGFRPVSDIWLGDKEDPVDRARMDVMIRGVNGEKWEFLDEVREIEKYVIPEISVLK